MFWHIYFFLHCCVRENRNFLLKMGPKIFFSRSAKKRFGVGGLKVGM